VVVAAFTDRPDLERCLCSLEAQTHAAEVIVASDLPELELKAVAARFPDVRFVNAPGDGSALALRSLGVQAARGRLVALTEGQCTVDPGWVAALWSGYRTGRTVLGGVVENGRPSGFFDRALYWLEYAAQMPPLPDGVAARLSGVNAAYDRGALFAVREIWEHGFAECEVHAALERAGHLPYRVRAAGVTSHLRLSWGEALVHLYRGGERFGRWRASRSARAKRAALRVAVLLVPVLLCSRVAAAVLTRHPRETLRLLLSLPVLACLSSAWAWGEAAGYWSSGTPGAS